MREDETGDHGGSMRRERDMLRLRVAEPSRASEIRSSGHDGFKGKRTAA